MTRVAPLTEEIWASGDEEQLAPYIVGDPPRLTREATRQLLDDWFGQDARRRRMIERVSGADREGEA